MIREHYRAARALIPAEMTVFLWNVPRTDAEGNPTVLEYPYVVLWGTLPQEYSGDLLNPSVANEPDSLDFRIRATYVGLDPDSMLIVVRNTRRALAGKRLEVAGWRTSKLRQQSLTEPELDRDVTVDNRHPVFAVDEYTFTSHRG